MSEYLYGLVNLGFNWYTNSFVLRIINHHLLKNL